MSSFSAENIRGDFPILEHLIYLDNAATSLSPRQVVEEQVEAEFNYRANVGRGVHRLGRMATHKYENARSAVKSRISINSFLTRIIIYEGLNTSSHPLIPPPKKKENHDKSQLFLDVFFNLHPVLNRFHLIDIITKCSQHIFHSHSLQRCYLHQPCMKDIFDHCIGSLPL